MKRKLVLHQDVSKVRGEISSKELAIRNTNGIFRIVKNWSKEWDVKVPRSVGEIPFWMLERCVFDYRATMEKKGCVSATVRRTIEEILSKYYKDHLKIYTDASQKDGRVGIGLYVSERDITAKIRVENEISVFHSELVGIYLAMLWLKRECKKGQLAIICTDSLSSMKYLEGFEEWYKETIGLRIVNSVHYLYKVKGIRLTICYVPAHVGILGNEKADKVAKSACEKETVDISVDKFTNEIYQKIDMCFKAEGIKLMEDAIKKLPKYYEVIERCRRNDKIDYFTFLIRVHTGCYLSFHVSTQYKYY